MPGKLFEPGNQMGKGRPSGSANKTTMLQELLDKGGEEIVKKVTRLALDADPTALRLCMERLIPAARTVKPCFALPPVETAADLTKAIAAVLEAVSEGELSPQEGESVTRIIESQRRAIGTEGFEARIRALEKAREEQAPAFSSGV